MEVFFLKGTRGSLFSVYHPAHGYDRRRLSLVYVPPFAEEMNRARRMAALQARRLSELGIDVLLLDPFGTGDSEGDFGDARWDIWCDDVRTAMNWLAVRTNAPVGLWGLRLGALLAADVASRQSRLSVSSSGSPFSPGTAISRSSSGCGWPPPWTRVKTGNQRRRCATVSRRAKRWKLQATIWHPSSRARSRLGRFVTWWKPTKAPLSIGWK